jgi:hypothetical protein
MVTITVNGIRHEVQAPGDTPLLYVLRNDLQLSGPQFGCGQRARRSCDRSRPSRRNRKSHAAAPAEARLRARAFEDVTECRQ